MKFRPKQPDTIVNRAGTHPLLELFWMVGGLILIVGMLFLALGLITDLSVKKIPLKVERVIGEKLVPGFPGTRLTSLDPLLTQIMNKVPEDSIVHRYGVKLYSYESPEINALAMPGGRILISEGLLKALESENELVMVLGHELGHYDQRDHLRGLGRGLGMVVLASLITGPNSRMTDFVMTTFLSFQLNYSRAQESSADEFGVELLIKHYGHGGGSIEFFDRLLVNNPHPPEFLSTHPDPENRIDHIRELIKRSSAGMGDTVPFQIPVELTK